jgi:subtilisin family serine protease
MKYARLAVLMFVLLSLAGSSWAGVIAPALATRMQSLDPDDEVKVLVVLRDQADIPAIHRQLHESRATRHDRHLAVVGALREAASRSQDALLSDLESRQRAGGIRGYTPHWLINAVVVVGTVDAIRELAAREDVEAIEPDLKVELIEPVQDEKSAPGGGQRGIGMCPGIDAINAPRVWRELGIDGTGVIVANMDTGVDGTHPALSARWRGNFADPSECWLDNSGQGSPSFPVDYHYLGHGTHVMGTITGQAPDDTIGVAPGALWIAANTIDQGVSTEFDNDVLQSLEWFADPDGDPETSVDVPCVAQNSWGVFESLGYPDCYSYWWTAIDNCEAAGCVLTWSAGNEGPTQASLRSPGDRADTPYNAFSVGSTQNYAPFNISDFSSRGPSNCGGPYAMKPEVCAPGSSIYSSQPGGGYQYLDGTSMAGPHVAGVVALMCAANPDLDHETIKQVLMETAVDLGVPGEDNTYGHGFIDAYEAVLSVLGGLGTVSGVVTDGNTGLPIEGVRIEVIDRPVYRTTGSDGYFEIMLPVGQWTLTYEVFGYGDESLVVDIVENETADGSVNMPPLPTAALVGTVYDYEGALVSGASIEALDTPLTPAYSGPDGSYSLELPAGAVYDVVARKAGYGADQQSVDFQGSTVLDFTLPELTAEDFESGDFLSYPWEMSGDAGWTIDVVNPYEGTYSAMSGDITHNQESEMSVTLNVTAASDISFWYKVSSEDNYDYLRFYVDGAQVQSWSGQMPWSQFTYAVSEGEHTFKWAYTKDYSVSSGTDAAWIDYVEFPTVGEPPVPGATFSPASVEESVVEGETTQSAVLLGNEGTGDLEYSVTIEYTDGPGDEPVAGYGGPDAFGYSWIDSDAVGGPTYDWYDISGVGLEVPIDNNHGPFALGFDFPYYGQMFNSVYVGYRGWISFTSMSGVAANQPIPTAGEPNNLLAAFWDDLNPNAGGTIYYYEDMANNRFIMQWDDVWHFPSGPAETFQVILYPNGTIVYQYHTVGMSGSCTVGIENADGTDGLEVLYNTEGYLHDGLAIQFAVDPGLAWLTVSPSSGTVVPQGSDTIELTMDAASLQEGTYYADVIITTNDPTYSQIVVPVTLTVTPQTGVDDEVVASTVFFGAVPNPFGPETSLRFSLARESDVDLMIYDVAGRLVKTLVSGMRPAGANEARWNGRDNADRSVASGTYFARLVVGDRVEIRSLTLVR